jgi:hypothetical protein
MLLTSLGKLTVISTEQRISERHPLQAIASPSQPDAFSAVIATVQGLTTTHR